MSEPLTCVPRTLPPERVEAAAKKAIEVNPENEPTLAPQAQEIPGFEPDPKLLAAVTRKLWAAPVRLTVGFLDNPESALRQRILSHMNAWNRDADIEFTETQDMSDADVRINRQPADDPQWRGYWSYLGTDILDHHGPFNQTMNLEGFTMNTRDSEFYRVVRHETGHTLGFPHEHMRPELVAKIDRDKAIAYYGDLCGWTPKQVVQQVLTPLNPRTLTATWTADPNSIMAYQVPGRITKDGQPIVGGLDIDETDYRFCGRLYPR